MCIGENWHQLTYAVFEHWNDKDQPDPKVLSIRQLIKNVDTGEKCVPFETPKPQLPANAGDAEPPGPTLGTSHARSECIDDYWHVVTDEDWIRADGTHFKRRHDEKTSHSCKPGDPVPPELPGGTQPQDKGEKIEPKEVKECVNGFWWYRMYPQYRKPDGSTWVDTGKDNWLQEYTKNEPCTGAAVVPGVLKTVRPTGAYVGGVLTKNTSAVRTTQTFAEGGQVINQFDDSRDPIGAGVVVGINLLVGRVTVGPFGSFDWRNQTINRAITPTTYVGTTTHWSVQAGGRAGVVAGGLFVYGLGAVGWLNQDLSIDLGHGATSESTLATGVTVGGGVEFSLGVLQRLRHQARVFVEYQFSNWQDVTLSTPAASPSFNYTFHRRDQAVKFGILINMKR